MIKIEFKEVQRLSRSDYDIYCKYIYSKNIKYHYLTNGVYCNIRLSRISNDCIFHYLNDNIKRISNINLLKDPMLDRSEILTQLGITEQEDELFQQQYKNV